MSPAPTSQARSTVAYMPALDGLRALAVIAVVLYHLGVPHTQGGLIGVTVFFVISGYLITKLLLDEYLRTRTIDFKRFYVKRVKRLLPAIVTVIVVTAAACTLFSHPLLTKMRPDVLPSLFFFNNWWQVANEASYFDNLGAPSPLTHFWSLAIEEQFYLVLPLVLFICLSLGARRKHMIAGTLGAAAVSVLAMALLYDPAADPTRVYYGTDTRAFSLLLGVALAFLTFGRRPGRLSRRACDLLALVGIGGLLAFVVLTDGTGPFLYRGGFLLASLLSCLAIVGLVEPGQGVMARLFSVAPLLWVGTRSYGIYLWHYPIVLLMRPQNLASEEPWWLMPLMAAVICLVAEASYRLVEQPIRTGTFALWRPVAERIKAARPQRGRQAAQSGRAPRRAEAAQQPRGRRGHAGRPAARPAASALGLVGRLNPVVVGASLCAAVALGGLALVPDTSILSEEGAALLEGSDEAVTTDSIPMAEAMPASSLNESENTYLRTDTRTESQKAFDQALVQTPVPEGAYDVLWIGDSVSIRAVPYGKAAFPSGRVDAQKNRTLDQGVQVYEEYLQQGLAGNVVVFALGTNGAVTGEQIDQALETVGPEVGVWFVTVRGADAADDVSNAAIWDAASRYENVRVVDWYAASEGHEDYFDGDGTHLSEKGAQVYTSLIADGVAVQLPQESVDFQTDEDNQQTMVDNWNQPSADECAEQFARGLASQMGVRLSS